MNNSRHSKPIWRVLGLAAWLGANALQGQAQINLPLEIKQNLTTYNRTSTGGAPLSSVVDDPIGSNGNAPTLATQQAENLTINPPTVKQFSTVLSWGSVVRSSVPNNFPSSPIGANRISIRRGQVGATFLNRSASYLFGGIIPAPNENEDGTALDPSISSEEYWLREPHLINQGSTHIENGYYYSPHARAVFAIQAGPVDITWRKATPNAATPADSADTTKWFESVGNFYRLYTKRYVISGSPSKKPRKIYWNQAGFNGPQVEIPASRIGELNIVYNNTTFRAEVPASEGIPAIDTGVTSQGTEVNQAVYTKTLWHEGDYLKALNEEGRVFVELLGDLKSDGSTRFHLGYEIIDVAKFSSPADLTIELGDKITAYSAGEPGDEAALTPQPIVQVGSYDFAYQAGGFSGSKIQLYAVKETKNLNDYQIHWMEEGLEGILWPARHVRYRFTWPENPARYSHYVRPAVSSETEAKATAVPMPLDNVPFLQYQDILDQPRAFLTEKYEFYTYLTTAFPQHRTLLRFTSGENVHFERVFSWLETNVKSGDIGLAARSPFELVPARQLKIWGLAGGTAHNLLYDSTAKDASGQAAPVTQMLPGFLNSTQLTGPRYITQTVSVGDRIEAPTAELGTATDDPYWAGYILQNVGNAYNPIAYIDPIAEGFEAANLGAIIPVNADPGNNQLEIYWYRKNNPDLAQGFKTIYWPSAFGRYTIQWPTNPDEIILASNAGSGELLGPQTSASIYTQNDSSLPGYNPNEEHALMLAGRAYALRDDLNITDPAGYTSDPFVLLKYTAADGRPSMRVFKVLREKPSQGIVFDYITEAGQLLQAPMPLPFLEKPTEGIGSNRVNYNREVSSGSGDLPVNWATADSALKTSYDHYSRFTYEDRKGNHYIYRGPHSGPPALQAGTWNSATGTFDSPAAGVAVVGNSFEYTIHSSRRKSSLLLSAASSSPLPAWLTIQGLTLTGLPRGEDVMDGTIELVLSSVDGDVSMNLSVPLVVTADTAISEVVQAPLNLSYDDNNGVTMELGDRPPYLALLPTEVNSLSMVFYYRTLAGFAWPSENSPPAVGSIVPYLRPLDGSGGYIGQASSKQTEALNIVYRPVWPAQTEALNLSETLAEPIRSITGVRGQSSVKVLYQQSIGLDFAQGDAAGSVVLHDPTREKQYLLGAENELQSIPASVNTYNYQGRTYFPNLPPYLSQRLFFDPNRGDKGALVFQGKFQDEATGEKYFLLNVLSGDELQIVKDLCPAADTTNKPLWETAVDEMATLVETYYEPVEQPGSWIANDSSQPVVGLAGDAALAKYSVPIGDLAIITHDDTAVDSYAMSASGPGTGYVTIISNDGNNPANAGLPVGLAVLRVSNQLHNGEVKVLYSSNPLDEQVTFQHTVDAGGKFQEFEYEWKIQPPIDGREPAIFYTSSEADYDAADPTKLKPGWTPLENGLGSAIPRYTLGGSGIQTLTDNYIIMRYRPTNPVHPGYGDTDASGALSPAEIEAAWSDWTKPQLAEGWIKRVLAGINPFNQRVTDLFNNAVNTDASILTQAGTRWEGDIALNLDNINDHGLISIYETVLNRGIGLSLDAGINYGPANDALLLAAGYINDLYMMLGNEAWADAANPTIGIGTKDNEYGDISTALFAFKGQVASLMDEELSLLRGRDDFLQPGVDVRPFYNRLIWNYTRGIDSGEVIYALNYNIQEDQGVLLDGTINAADAARMYPQGHGDAYGHYLSALKGYYRLLVEADFTWAPRTEAVTVLGTPVQVDYFDERKFASAAAAVARAGKQIFDLTWRKDYRPGKEAGWGHFSATRANNRRLHTEGSAEVPTVRHWGTDHWATRAGIGSMVNWVVGNAILPDEDTNPDHEGIQIIDRTTVPELRELTTLAESFQTGLDNAEAFLTPLGLPEDALAFDINPNLAVPAERTHFEQVLDRAEVALVNAVTAFDDSKDVTRLMRSEEDSLADFQSVVNQQEAAFESQLVELYGTPYADDIGAGKTFPQGYLGPDYFHFMYVDRHEIAALGDYLGDLTADETFAIDVQDFPETWVSGFQSSFYFYQETENLQNGLSTDNNSLSENAGYTLGRDFIEYVLPTDGFFGKPSNWRGRRLSPGRIQQSISEVIRARADLRQALGDAESLKGDLDTAVRMFAASGDVEEQIRRMERDNLIAADVLRGVTVANDIFQTILDSSEETVLMTVDGVAEAFPKSLIAGLAAGGDVTSAGRAAAKIGSIASKTVFDTLGIARQSLLLVLTAATESAADNVDFYGIAPLESALGDRESVLELEEILVEVQDQIPLIAQLIRDYHDAQESYRMLLAEGDSIQNERLIFRQRASAVIQGYRTRDAAFRIFRNEKLERYKTLFDLSAKYTFLAAKAYDYETGLLNTTAGKDFLKRIINSRALGVIRNGVPQYAASSTGDPGLSSVVAEMKADWGALRGRLGFNNPDTYGTTVSLRSEKFRILPSSDGTDNWKDVLEAARVDNLLMDEDIRRYCMQIDSGSGLPVPGIVLEFSTVVADGLNLFGAPLASGDSYFSASSFANKIFSVGIAFEGYRGILDPATNNSAVSEAGGTSPSGAWGGFLDPMGLAATPYVYLIPVGLDSMRTPPLGDATGVRTWNVKDVAIPLPFNIGASDLNTKQLWLSSESLSEELFTVRKHQPFRAVSNAGVFQTTGLSLDEYTNRRLIGRSVWNSKWKLVIPGRSLLNDSNEGLDRFIQTVNDIKLHLRTYSYSGN